MADEEDRIAEEPGKAATEPVAEDELAAKDRRILELTDDLKRLQADFDNFKKRSDREWKERSKIATQRLMADLLPLLDSFDKALEDAKENGSVESLRKGLAGLHRQMLQILQREGLKEIDTGKSFDPFMHEALMREEREDVQDGKILEVYQKGYALGDKAIRPAKVKVAKRKEPEELPAPEASDIHDNQIDTEETKEDRGDDEDDSIKG